MQIFKLIAKQEDDGLRLDKFLSRKVDGLTRSAAEKQIEAGNAGRNGKILGKSYRVTPGDEIDFSQPEPEPLNLRAEEIPLEIPYEDDDLLVVNKPKGMVVHPAAGHWEGTLVNALLAHWGDASRYSSPHRQRYQRSADCGKE